MSTLYHLFRMWLAGALALCLVTLRRLLLGPTLPTWTWRTEWAVSSARAVISVAARYRDDPRLFRFGLWVTTPVPWSLRSKVDVKRMRLGSLKADTYRPSAGPPSTTTLLYFHGGGYAFGNPGTHRQFISQLVHSTQTSAIAPTYRLAPYHQFPAAVDDAHAAYRALLESGVAAESVIVCGDSAGAGLALALLLRARSESLPMPQGAILFSPYADLAHTGYTIRTNAATDYLPLSELSRPNDWYATASDMRNPEASPVHADLTGLPPMLILAGGAEMLLHDAIRIKEHADRDGVEATLHVEPNMVHVWPAIVEWEAGSRNALDLCSRFMEDLSGPSG